MAKNSILEIASAIADTHGLTQQDAEVFVTSFFDVINDGLHHEKAVKVKGLGTFKVIDVRERESVNVNTGERVLIEGHGKITFTADPVMRDLVNKPFAQFETVVLNEGVELEDMSKVLSADLEEDNIDDVDSGTVNDDIDEVVSQEDKIESRKLLNDDNDLFISEQNVASDGHDIGAEVLDEKISSENTEDFDVHVDDADCGSDNLKYDDMSVGKGHSVNASVADDSISEYEFAENVNQAVSDEDMDKITLHDDELHSDISTADASRDDGILKNKTDRFRNSTIEQFVATGHIDGTSDVSGKDDVRKRSSVVWYYWILIMLVVAVFSFWGGCYWEKFNAKPIIKYVTVRQSVTPKAVSGADSSIKNDSVKTIDDKLKQTEGDTVNVKKNIADKSKLQNEVKSSVSSPNTETRDLRNAENTVRTGAYRIVGTDHVVIVKKGETLKKISKFYLGDGMECYIMVHNGITDIKEGMRLKIPKLVDKRK
ncbi:HU family DNA-binding protein [uncultured Prevotella sp.]|uniref:HU family DNA-binding protein n=1 Tax=uncultured Prevotella sp. TaxID=159272 RepID=UPI002624438C|nr:HU family DNA-binding protein [uncultured Prevotella sp.]